MERFGVKMIVPLILWVLIILFFIPYYVVTMTVFVIYRLFVNSIVWLCRTDIVEHLTSKDLVFMSDEFDGKVRKSVINASLLNGRMPIEQFREAIKTRLLDKPFFVRLHCRPFLFMGYWFWQKTEINIEDHIFEWNETMTEEGLKQFLPSWNQKGYPPNSPMWTAILVPMTNGRSVAIFKIHHMVADGISFMRLLENYMDPGWVNLKTPEVKSFSWMHWIYAWYQLPLNFVKSYRLARVRKGFRPAGFAGEGFTSFTLLPLEKIKVVRRSTKCVFQSVLAGILANAFQKLLEKNVKPENIPTVVRSIMPIPWPNRREDGMSNHVAWLHADLPIGGGLKSLSQFEKNVRESYISGMHGVLWHFFRGMYVVPNPVLRKYACFGEEKLPPVLVSSLPGTMNEVSLCGHKVLKAYPILSLGCTMGINVCACTYVDMVSFTVRVSKEVLSSQELVDQLLNKYVHEELDAYYQKIISEEECKKKRTDVHIQMPASPS